MKKIAPVKIRFRAIGVPAVRVVRHGGDSTESETPNWKRLQKHIEAHRAAGGRVHITTTRFDYPQHTEGWAVIEMKNVTLDWEPS